MRVAHNATEVVVELSDGRVLRGAWHSSMKGRPKLLGRCVDLSKAFKQVAIDCQSLVHGVLGFQTMQSVWRLYTTQTLLFGASASVFAFNKISRALWHLPVHKLSIVTSVFYDDFPCFEVEPLTEHTTKVLNGFFDVLNFAGGFVLGHALKPASHLLLKWLGPTRPHPQLKTDVRNLVEALTKMLEPREVKITDNP